MKKVIAAAAGLLLAGAMVSSAVADVTVSGDSRVRFYYQDAYGEGTASQEEDETHWNSRVRLNFDADMESGVYARTRITLNAGTWGQTNDDEGQPWHAQDDDKDRTEDRKNISLNYAYLGVPLGNNIAVEAGNMDVTITNMVFHDENVDALAFKWAQDNHQVLAFYAKAWDSYGPADGSTDNGDEDVNVFGLRYEGAYDAFGIVLGGTYASDDTANDNNGMVLTARVTGNFEIFSLSADIAHVDKEVNGDATDDGVMGYATVGFALGEATTLTGVAGFTEDATMEPPVGFFMIAGDTQITPGATSKVGALGDTTFVGLVVGHQLNEKIALTGTLAYADIETESTGSDGDIEAVEVGAKVAYSINDDATFSVMAGFLDLESSDGSGDAEMIGVGAELAITF